MIKCPYCDQEIQNDAIQCKHCNKHLETNDVGISPPIYKESTERRNIQSVRPDKIVKAIKLLYIALGIGVLSSIMAAHTVV